MERRVRLLRDTFLMTQPPLVAVMQGGAKRLSIIRSRFDRRGYSLPKTTQLFVPKAMDQVIVHHPSLHIRVTYR